MIGDGHDLREGVGVVVTARLSLVARPLDDVEEVRNDASGEEGLTSIVEVDSPGIAGAPREDLELPLRRVIAPDPGVDRHALLVGSSRCSDVRVGEDAVATVEPAIGSPGEAIEGFVGVLIGPAVEQYLGFAIGHQVVIAVGNEVEIGCRADPDATEADLEAADEVQVVGEDRARLVAPVVVAILEDQDGVLPLAILAPHRIAVGFGHPQAALVIKGQGDRLV